MDLQIAESWLNESFALISGSPDAFKSGEAELVVSRLKEVRESAGHPNTDAEIPTLTDVMFYVF